MPSPAISVVMPAFNTREWIEESLDSLYGQTFSDWELIIVNDCSTDGTGEVCRQAALDPRVRLVEHDRQRGAGAARNSGIDAATGTYVYLFDSDDLLRADALETMHAISEEHRLDALFFGSAVLCSDPSLEYRVRECEAYYARPVTGLEVLSGPGMLQLMLERNAFVATPGLQFYRRSALARVRFPEGAIYEDNPFTMAACLESARAGMIPDRLFVRRLRASSVMHRGDMRTREHEFLSFQSAAEGMLRAVGEHEGELSDEMLGLCWEFALGFYRNALNALHTYPAEHDDPVAYLETRAQPFSAGAAMRLFEERAARIDELEREAASLRDELGRARADADGLSRELEGVRASTSLRVGLALTAPLRALRRAASGRR